MDEKSALELCQELYRVAKADPGAGAAVLMRSVTLCRQIHESAPNLRLLKQLRRLQNLMSDWTAADGWKKYGHGPIVLRGELVEAIARVSDLACPRAHAPAKGLRQPAVLSITAR